MASLFYHMTKEVLSELGDERGITGRTWSLDRRDRLVNAATKHQVMIIEDNPYGELRFEGSNLYSNMPEERIIEGIKRLGEILREFV